MPVTVTSQPNDCSRFSNCSGRYGIFTTRNRLPSCRRHSTIGEAAPSTSSSSGRWLSSKKNTRPPGASASATIAQNGSNRSSGTCEIQKPNHTASYRRLGRHENRSASAKRIAVAADPTRSRANASISGAPSTAVTLAAERANRSVHTPDPQASSITSPVGRCASMAASSSRWQGTSSACVWYSPATAR